ncbi:MAG: hypothetical protein IJ240_04095 [Clostridia bacterium]|nr:hypothetical protein [Clostridia bacterium]
MKKILALLMALTMVAVLLSGCAQEQVTYPDASTAQQQAQTVRQADVLAQETPEPVVPEIIFPEDDGTDEGDDYEDVDEGVLEAGDWSAYGASSAYAGATPIPLDPIDMPTATPRPELEFTYTTYTALRYNFSVPEGWIVTEEDNTYTLTDPVEREGVNGSVSITVTPVSSGYKLSDVKTELSNQLKSIQRNYVTWRIWTADSRKMLDSDGYFNTYRGETYDGTVVRGLVHIALVNNSLVMLQFKAPGWYNSSYQRVYNTMRNSLKGV